MEKAFLCRKALASLGIIAKDFPKATVVTTQCHKHQRKIMKKFHAPAQDVNRNHLLWQRLYLMALMVLKTIWTP
ncbi:hypothetical protein DPMN_094624 [Dreissena polymorpha]|uniref:Uncharacterized protein n=1 Tax=Dreissena polymorpha TaxID=45954 RepID=A0A9D4L5U2_DREPO|nr:hypothetical protein DPMN_094624 [Dreissena polymorpha]